NPGYQAAGNDREVADWEVRQAYGSLVPSASVSGGLSWQGKGEESFGSITSEQLGFVNRPSIYTSSYSLGLSYRLDGSVLFGPGQAEASRDRTMADIRAAAVDLDRRVTQAYLEVLRQDEEVTLAQQELERARFNLRLATAQRDVGTVTALDVQQAEVQVGRAEVTLLRAQNAARTARLRLNQTMGVDLDRPAEPSTEFALTPPGWTEDDLLARALRTNPTLESRRRGIQVSDYAVSVARSSYWPSLSFSAGWSGFTQQASSTDYAIARAQSQTEARSAQCQAQNELYSRLADPLPPLDCSQYVFTEEDRNAIVRENDVFPFDFQRSPPRVSMSVSLPIFQGLSRQRQVEAAQAARRDARYQMREQELALQADLAIGLDEVRTAYQSALIEQRNQAYADEQLRLALERYRVGTISFIDLVEAETVKAQADRSRLNAIYSYHDAITNLESVVGAPLRERDGGR
ncbi:MAG TPA: TolC family protein, partial [Longimicrobiales bacterium]|nr:TolC family protein [Longimicrobiales bacterium]